MSHIHQGEKEKHKHKLNIENGREKKQLKYSTDFYMLECENGIRVLQSTPSE